jgi:hypothetical protein
MKLKLMGGPTAMGFAYDLTHEEKRSTYSFWKCDAIRQAIGPAEGGLFILVRNSSKPLAETEIPMRNYGVAHNSKEAERRVYEDLIKWAKRQGYGIDDQTKYSNMSLLRDASNNPISGN